MILGEKIQKLRKHNAWSQEDLARELNVSRQSVSKWESSQSVPDLDRIVKMSQVFGVSLDYLLKEEIEDSGPMTDSFSGELPKLSMEEANRFLSSKEEARGPIANGVTLFILSPVLLMMLLTLVEGGFISMTEDLAAVIGIVVLLIFVALGVFIMINYYKEDDEFAYLKDEPVELAYGVEGFVKQLKKDHEPIYYKRIGIGAVLIIISSIPVIVTSILGEDKEYMVTLGACVLLLIIAAGVNLIVRETIKRSSFNLILGEGDYSEDERKLDRIMEPLGGIYWIGVTAIYVISGLIRNNWGINWIIWPAAGMIFAIISIIVDFVVKNKNY